MEFPMIFLELSSIILELSSFGDYVHGVFFAEIHTIYIMIKRTMELSRISRPLFPGPWCFSRKVIKDHGAVQDVLLSVAAIPELPIAPPATSLCDSKQIFTQTFEDCNLKFK
jgi:hypothetical protein